MKLTLAAALFLALGACVSGASGNETRFDSAPSKSDFEPWRKSTTGFRNLRQVSSKLNADLDEAATCWAGSELRFALIETEEPAVQALLAKGLVVEHDIWAYRVLSLMTADFAAKAEAEGTPFMQDPSAAMGSQLLAHSVLLASQARQSAEEVNATLTSCDEMLDPALQPYMRNFVGKLRILLPTNDEEGAAQPG